MPRAGVGPVFRHKHFQNIFCSFSFYCSVDKFSEHSESFSVILFTLTCI